MKQQTIAGKLTLEAIKKMPKAASRSIARYLRKQHSAVFTSVEKARALVRYYRGAFGKKTRRHAIQLRRPEEVAACNAWSKLIPDAEASKWKWETLPEEVKRWLVISDLHVPYHDKAALEVVFAHAEKNCDGVMILGDLVDAYQLSNFCKDPRCRDFAGEIETVKRFLDAIQALKPKKIIYKLGNHEMRLERYLMIRAPELFPAIAEKVSWESLLDLHQRKIKLIRAQDPIRHHQLAILHGHEWQRGLTSPVNPARGAFLRAGECTLSGHLHRKSNHTEMSTFGRVVQCWSIGCLCDMHPDYAPLNKWDQGFCYLNSGSKWSVENHSIINGEVL